MQKLPTCALVSVPKIKKTPSVDSATIVDMAAIYTQHDLLRNAFLTFMTGITGLLQIYSKGHLTGH